MNDNYDKAMLAVAVATLVVGILQLLLGVATFLLK